jgi:serine/threonine protein kinase
MTGNIEVSPQDLDADHVVPLGENVFGLVYQGELKKYGGSEETKPVVIKRLSDGAEAAIKKDFIKEMQIMKEVDHPHLLRLIGVVTVEPPLLMIFEQLSPGNLKTFLVSTRSSNTLQQPSMIKMCCDIANAMTYLSDNNVVHGDLVSNILVLIGCGLHVALPCF